MNKKSYLWTKSQARLHFLHANPGKNYNWLFLPGGPGLGSESLRGLTDLLHLPGSVWLADLPGDGSNTTVDDAAYFSCWSEALVEAASALPNLVLVAHSSGGMFALATPELENILTGLILMDSAPDSSWRSCFAQTVKENPLPEAEKRQVFYDAHPSNFLLKTLTIACASYFSTKISLDQIVNLLESLPFNYKTHQWAANHFHQTYQAKWIPQSLPTMIFAGDQDHLTPLRLFLKRQDFHRDNIVIREIKNGSHFPWIDNPKDVAQVFEEFCQQLDS